MGCAVPGAIQAYGILGLTALCVGLFSVPLLVGRDPSRIGSAVRPQSRSRRKNIHMPLTAATLILQRALCDGRQPGRGGLRLGSITGASSMPVTGKDWPG